MSKRVANRVLLIGWDAADWQMIRPLLARGCMPTLQRFIAEGVSGNLATIQPMLSPMLWTSIVTGKRADRHGICGFVEPRSDGAGIQPVTSTSRRCKALWNILSQSGLESLVVSWFASHPAEPIRGVVVSDRYAGSVSDPGGRLPEGTVFPADLTQGLAELLVTPADLDATALLPFVPRAREIDQERDDRLVKLAVLIAQAASVQAAMCHLLRTRSWDFAGVYFSAIDHFGHHFMPYHPPRLPGVSASDAAIYGDVMTGCYRFHDMMLEALLALAGEDATVMIVSDHGFLNNRLRPSPDAWKNPEQWHRPFGVVCARGPAIRRGETLYGATLLDVTPTILALLGLPLGEDMDGRAWLEILRAPVYPERTASWEDVPGDAGMHPADLRVDPGASAEMIRRLVQLGYMDAPDEDAAQAVRKAQRDARINLALAVAQSRRSARALELWSALADDYPDEEGFLVQLALCELRLGRFGQARRTIGRMSAELRDSPVVQLLEASLALARGDRADAITRAQRVAGLSDRELGTAVLNRVGEIFLHLERWTDAAGVFEKSLALDSDNPVAHDGLAQAHLAQDQAASAADHALQAVGLAHFFPAAHFHLGEALTRIDRHAEAIAAYETSLQLGYPARAAHLRLAELCAVDNPQKAEWHRWAAERA